MDTQRNRKWRWLIGGVIVAIILIGTAAYMVVKSGQQTATPIPTVVVTQTVTAQPTASGTPTEAPSASTSPSSEPSSAPPTADVPTTGPQSDTPITRVCLGVPTNLHYVGQCRVSSDLQLTGRQAFEACVMIAENDLYTTNSAYGRKHQANWKTNTHLCVASIGMTDYGEVYGYPASNKRSVKYFVLQDAENNITRLFDGKTGLYIPNAQNIIDKVMHWSYQFTGGGD